jgi:hypothetical protein
MDRSIGTYYVDTHIDMYTAEYLGASVRKPHLYSGDHVVERLFVGRLLLCGFRSYN